MSDLSTLAVTGTLFSFFSFLLYYSTAKYNNRGHEILTGVVAGVPVSSEYRSLLLWITWLPQVAAQVVGNTIFGVMFVALARQASGADARVIAYLCAIACGSGAVFTFFLAFPYLKLLASSLRRSD
jgi:ABC-type enterochelin transport system permease subunit